MKEAGTHVAPELAAAYADAFTAYLADRGERELGAAYDIGRPWNDVREAYAPRRIVRHFPPRFKSG